MSYQNQAGREPETPGEVQEVQLKELLDRLVGSRGRTGAADVLGVNYRTLSKSIRSGSLSRRMRSALEEYAGRDVAGEQGQDQQETEKGLEATERRLGLLEREVREFREVVGTQAGQLQELGIRLAEMLEARDSSNEAGRAVEGVAPSEWTPPRRAHGLPDAGVVTPETQSDEAHAFGPAVDLVSEWRGLRTRNTKSANRLENAKAEERRWELELVMIEKYGLTLPPETEPLPQARRSMQMEWRRKALESVRQERMQLERLRMLRRVLTICLWWR